MDVLPDFEALQSLHVWTRHFDFPIAHTGVWTWSLFVGVTELGNGELY